MFNASKRFPARSEDGRGDGGKAGAIGIAESSNGVVGGSAYRVNWNGKPVPLGRQYKKMREDGWAEKMLQHTFKLWKDIENEG